MRGQRAKWRRHVRQPTRKCPHLLGLGDEALLQRLDLLNHLVRAGVAALELAPPVHVERVLQLLAERLDLGALLQQLAAQLVHLALEHVNVGHAALEDVQLALEVVELDLEHADLVEPVPVLYLPLAERALLDLDLLVQQSQLVVAADELRAGQSVAERAQRLGQVLALWSRP